MRRAIMSCIVMSAILGINPSLAEPTVDWGGKPQGADWSRFVHEAVAADANRLVSSVPRDMRDFCPNYEQLPEGKRRETWGRLFSLLAF